MMTACIVDDDQIYVYTFKKLLSLKNISVQLLNFASAAEAISFLSDPANADKLPDVIFLDINMPVMDGWDFMETFTEIKSKLGKDITVYMVSSSINSADLRRAQCTPDITDYLTKPLAESTLVNLLNATSTEQELK